MILKNKIYFIAGIGTDIGKTFLVEKICSKLQEEAIAFNAVKPIISGFRDDDLQSDSAKILRILKKDFTKKNFDEISPWRFKAAISPNLAAHQENKEIDFAQVVNFCQEKISEAIKLDQFLFIEAAGGVMTPITNDKTFLNLISKLQVEVLLVSANYLGSISHSLCAVEALKSKGILPEIILVNEYPEFSDTNISQLVATIENLSKIKTMSFDVFLD